MESSWRLVPCHLSAHTSSSGSRYQRTHVGADLLAGCELQQEHVPSILRSQRKKEVVQLTVLEQDHGVGG